MQASKTGPAEPVVTGVALRVVRTPKAATVIFFLSPFFAFLYIEPFATCNHASR